MLEIKKKFIPTGAQKKKLLEGAKFLGEEKFTDEYYDNENFSLAFNDIWLSKRGEEFNLKIPIHESREEFIEKYYRIKGEMAIRDIFAIPMIGTFEKDLESFGHKPFGIFETVRNKYEKNGFIINLDEADFGDWQYELVEIELLVESKDEMKDAEERVYEFASRFGLGTIYSNGKLKEFIKRKMPDIYEKLKKEKVVY